MKLRWKTLIVLCLSLSAGCRTVSAPDPFRSDDGGISETEWGEDGGGDESPFKGLCSVEDLVGRFELVFQDGVGHFDGFVVDGPGYWGLGHEVIAQEGLCELRVKKAADCEPHCGSGTLCNPQAECVPVPSNVDLGSVLIHGPGDPLAIQSLFTFYYSSDQYDVSPDEIGAYVEVTKLGGELEDFFLYGLIVEPLVVQEEGLELNHGQPLALHWDQSPGAQEIEVVLRTFGGGYPEKQLVCSFPDNGEATVPSQLIDLFLDQENSEIGQLEIRRVTKDSTSIELGCVELIVSTYGAASFIE